MNATREHDEALRDLELVSIRRLGYNRVHFALVLPSTLHAATVFGAPCTSVTAPVKAWCGRTLRGDLISIPDDKLAGWREQGHVCRECVTMARAGLALARERGAA